MWRRRGKAPARIFDPSVVRTPEILFSAAGIEELRGWGEKHADTLRRAREIERAHFPPEGDDAIHTYEGFCYSCYAPATFAIDWDNHKHTPNGREPRFRERLHCTTCKLIARQRVCLNMFEHVLRPPRMADIYLPEFQTRFFREIAARYPRARGSEYMGPDVEPGAVVGGMPVEDMTRLSFEDESLDYVLAFEVLEHIPFYTEALSESHRVLRPGGALVLTAPFMPGQYDTLVRATINAKGEVVHNLEPEYHFSSTEDVLCFYHFGWDLMDSIRDAGFTEVTSHWVWSEALGYLDELFPVFVAKK